MNLIDTIMNALFPVGLLSGNDRLPVVQGTKLVSLPAGFLGINARKTADQAVSATSALTADSHMFFSVGPNEEWAVDWTIYAGNNISGTGLNIGLSCSGVAALQFGTALLPDVIAAANKIYQTTTTSGTKLVYDQATQSGVSKCVIRASAWVQAGTTSSVVKLKFSPISVGGNPVIFLKGSYMNAVRVA